MLVTSIFVLTSRLYVGDQYICTNITAVCLWPVHVHLHHGWTLDTQRLVIQLLSWLCSLSGVCGNEVQSVEQWLLCDLSNAFSWVIFWLAIFEDGRWACDSVEDVPMRLYGTCHVWAVKDWCKWSVHRREGSTQLLSGGDTPRYEWLISEYIAVIIPGGRVARSKILRGLWSFLEGLRLWPARSEGASLAVGLGVLSQKILKNLLSIILNYHKQNTSSIWSSTSRILAYRFEHS